MCQALSAFETSCPVRASVSVLAGKWVLLILQRLSEQPHRFTALRENIKGITDQALVRHLRQLRGGGVICLADDGQYRLTELGARLGVAIDALEHWGRDYIRHLEMSK